MEALWRPRIAMIDHPQLNTLRNRWLRMAETRHGQARNQATVEQMRAYIWAAAAFEIASTELAMVQTGDTPPPPGERWAKAEEIAERVAKHLSKS